MAASLAGAALTTLAFLSEHFVVPWIDESVERLPLFANHGWAAKTGAGVVSAFVAYMLLTRIYKAAPFVRDAIFHHREEHLRALRAFAEAVATLDARASPQRWSTSSRKMRPRRSPGSTGVATADSVLPMDRASRSPPRRATSDGRVPASFAPLVADDGSAAFAMLSKNGMPASFSPDRSATGRPTLPTSCAPWVLPHEKQDWR